MTVRVADTLEIRRWTLEFGIEAEVIAPAALREGLRRETEALALKLSPQRLPAGPLTPRRGG
jgi:predicted DNA-binding transcriptional regulator YafY